MKRLFILLLFVPSLACAEQWFQNGEPAEPKPDHGSVNGFGAMIIMTADSQKALENWSKLTKGVVIPDAERVSKGKPIEALVLFSGCAANERGNCVAEVDYVITKPDGSIYAEYKNTELWRNKPALPEGRIGLAIDRVGLIAEPQDPVGAYKVTCVVRDLVTSSEFKIYSAFEVVEAKN
jgi:hypothetical protein